MPDPKSKAKAAAPKSSTSMKKRAATTTNTEASSSSDGPEVEKDSKKQKTGGSKSTVLGVKFDDSIEQTGAFGIAIEKIKELVDDGNLHRRIASAIKEEIVGAVREGVAGEMTSIIAAVTQEIKTEFNIAVVEIRNEVTGVLTAVGTTGGREEIAVAVRDAIKEDITEIKNACVAIENLGPLLQTFPNVVVTELNQRQITIKGEAEQRAQGIEYGTAERIKDATQEIQKTVIDTGDAHVAFLKTEFDRVSDIGNL